MMLILVLKFTMFNGDVADELFVSAYGSVDGGGLLSLLREWQDKVVVD